MGKVSKFWQKWHRLSGFGKLAFFKSAGVLFVIKAGLTLLPFNRFRKIFSNLTHSRQAKSLSDQQISDVVWAVNTMANNLPFQLLCLPRALATKYLLRDVDSLVLQIGVDVNKMQSSFEAHAWVEKNGRIIIGEWPETTSYHTLWAWE